MKRKAKDTMENTYEDQAEQFHDEPDFDPAAEQSADESGAWAVCRMLRLQVSSDPVSFHVLMIKKPGKGIANGGKIVGDFTSTQGEEGVYIDHAHALLSLVGDRATERDLRKNGWKVGKNVRYNVLTDEIEMIAV